MRYLIKSAKVVAFVVVSVTTIACTYNSASSVSENVKLITEEPMEREAKLESIADPQVLAEAVVFMAISVGCSQSSHFSVNARVDGDQCLLAIIRDKPDNCMAAPMRKSFRVNWIVPEQCQELELVFENPRLEK